jgi:WD repeat-containing protein 42A
MCVHLPSSTSVAKTHHLQAYLFDRRKVGRFLQEEWGITVASSDDVATCVRRFGRPSGAPISLRGHSEHIFGARMSESNGHEVHYTISFDLVMKAV